MKDILCSIAKLLTEDKLTLSVAESCSAGGLSSSLCSIPGSSSYFLGGIVAYSNLSKIRDLGIKEEDINTFSEVSRCVAEQMSIGVAQNFFSDFAVSTTGYTGPTGKEIGKVFISVKSPINVLVKEFHFFGNRKEITDQVIESALQILLSEIKLFIFGNK